MFIHFIIFHLLLRGSHNNNNVSNYANHSVNVTVFLSCSYINTSCTYPWSEKQNTSAQRVDDLGIRSINNNNSSAHSRPRGPALQFWCCCGGHIGYCNIINENCKRVPPIAFPQMSLKCYRWSKLNWLTAPYKYGLNYCCCFGETVWKWLTWGL